MKVKLLLFFAILSSCSVIAQLDKASVIKSIDEAKKTPLKVITLDISEQKFSEFPKEILGFINLETLRINGTFFKELPVEIKNLNKLKVLEFNHLEKPNLEFTELPESIATLKNIEYLGLIGLPNLKWNNCMELLSRLPKLDNIALMKNNFTVLPAGIDKLTTLKKIWLGGNNNLNASEVFDKLPNIEQVGFGGSQFSKLPDNMSNATELFNLWLANNKITSVTPLINNHKLVSITLDRNDLHEPPSDLGNLDSVKYLSLNKNPDINLVTLANELSKMKNLTHLSLNSNNISTLPEEFYKLTSLEVLSLKNNSFDNNQRTIIQEKLPNTKLIF